MSEKHSVTCLDCGKMYRDFAPEGDPTCQCAEKAVRAMKDEITRPHPAMTAVSDETGRDFPFADKETLARWLSEHFYVAEGEPENWDDLPEWHRARFRNCAQLLWHVIAALSASPVATYQPNDWDDSTALLSRAGDQSNSTQKDGSR